MKNVILLSHSRYAQRAMFNEGAESPERITKASFCERVRLVRR